jgi:hypothetical protein
MTDQDTMHSLPTVAVQKPPTLPTLLTEQVETDRRLTGIEQRLTGIERSQWYLLVLLALQEFIVMGSLVAVYLLGRH